MGDYPASKAQARKTTDLTDNIFEQPLLEVSKVTLNYIVSCKTT